MNALALALMLALPFPARAQPSPPAPGPVQPALKLPASPVKIPANKLGKITVEGAATTVKWVTLTPGLDVSTTPDGKTLYCTGPAGTYELLAYTAVGNMPSDPYRLTIVIGDPPQPAPNPPVVPPGPPVNPPIPADPLKAKIAAAWLAAAGTPVQKNEWRKDLAALYHAAAKVSADPAVTTASALKTKLATAAAVMVGPDALKEVRQVTAAELAAILPNDGDLTADQRTAVAALFAKLAGILDGMGN